MNGDFVTAEVAEIGTFQVVEGPENRFNYTLTYNSADPFFYMHLAEVK